ncbi:hypothetical protein O988_04596 [Pseudogymnoascus sp. VKM F-3808]|nr:hypothetical protein O988_04596 [Pseudogymnoascus sp. VKM F-3808]
MFPRPCLGYAIGLALGLVTTGVNAAPCDIYASGGNACVAAHSTTRALYDAFNGALYQVKRDSDGATTDVKPLAAGGVANAGTQDSFCAGTTCLISIIYDQSGKGNHLTQAPPGGAASGPDANGFDYLASAYGAPVTLGGKKAYGVFISPYTGYRCNTATGTATGNDAEGIYAVVDGTHYNSACCFDYGNAETNSQDTGNGHMETVYFGTGGGSGAGKGPWVMADLENGLFSGASRDSNPGNTPQTSRFVTAVVKGNNNNHWAIRGGNATSGSLSTLYDGVRPDDSYNPMKKEGAIILGIGGDNSNWAQGTFYEGVMTSGYPSDDTENAVQANIVAAGYGTTSLTSGPALTAGSSISLRVTTACCTADYITHSGATVNIQAVSSSSTEALRQQASWIVRTGLGFSGCFSFESKDTPGSFLRHSAYAIVLNANDGSKQFAEDATFCPQTGFNGASNNALRSWSYPTRYWRHYTGIVYIASNGGPHNFDAKASFNDDVSFTVGASLA